MKKDTKKQVISVLKIIISVFLVVACGFSMLGATLINVTRNYVKSTDFINQVNETDLNTVKFTVNGEVYSVNEFVKKEISEYMASSYRYAGFFINTAVDKAIDLKVVDRTIKKEALSVVDYLITADRKEAKMRLKKGINPIDEYNEKIKNSTTLEEAISIYIRAYILVNIENQLKMPIDKFIVLLSSGTYKILITASVIMILLMILVNFNSIFNTILYGSVMSLMYGIIIKSFQSKFVKITAGSEDLIGYTFAKPLVDSFNVNAVVSIVMGVILIVLYVLLFVALYKYAEKKTNQ